MRHASHDGLSSKVGRMPRWETHSLGVANDDVAPMP